KNREFIICRAGSSPAGRGAPGVEKARKKAEKSGKKERSRTTDFADERGFGHWAMGGLFSRAETQRPESETRRPQRPPSNLDEDGRGSLTAKVWCRRRGCRRIRFGRSEEKGWSLRASPRFWRH